ncbi:helix-turn-helix domain-containing protein [Melissococcus plutonius]|uniref:spr1629 family repressor/antitoxin n=1 Tax=Melissococcus plutonius TaxID=33970 RepID=UPI003C2EFD38
MFNGEKLRDIRVLNGLSRKELAELIGISEQAVWQYENSTIYPRLDIMSKFSRFFNVDPRFFINENKLLYVVREESIAYRNVDREQRAKTSSEAMYLEFVNDLVCKMNNKFSGINGLINSITLYVEKMRASGKDISECASYVRQKLNIQSNRDLLLTVEQAGIIVLEKSFTTKNTDAYSSWVEDTAYIVLGTTRKTFVRRNFDIAHELAHIVLHKKVKITNLTKDEFREVEREADEFAGCLLLPKDEFLKDLNLIKTTISNPKSYIFMKEKYFVSIAAMGYRAFSLGAISINQRNYFFANMNRLGYRKKEPYDLDWKIKRPKFILSFIDFLDENNIWKFADILRDNLYKVKFVSDLFSVNEEFFYKYLDDGDNSNQKFKVFE